ncbi:MAG: bactofilin family protein [Nitrospiraceae bacterium]
MMKKVAFAEEENITLLAKGVELKGEIRVEGTVRIDGTMDGEIRTQGTVMVGEEGLVKGTVNAGILINGGKVKATVTVTEKLQLLKSGILIGEVHAPVFIIDEGGQFQGVSDMKVKPWGEKPSPVAGVVQALPVLKAKSPALIEADRDQ